MKERLNDYSRNMLDNNTVKGLYNNCKAPSPVTCTGPDSERALRLYQERQERLSKVGTWRAGSAAWKHNDGDYIDPDYFIVEYN